MGKVLFPSWFSETMKSMISTFKNLISHLKQQLQQRWYAIIQDSKTIIRVFSFSSCFFFFGISAWMLSNIMGKYATFIFALHNTDFYQNKQEQKRDTNDFVGFLLALAQYLRRFVCMCVCVGVWVGETQTTRKRMFCVRCVCVERGMLCCLYSVARVNSKNQRTNQFGVVSFFFSSVSWYCLWMERNILQHLFLSQSR